MSFAFLSDLGNCRSPDLGVVVRERREIRHEHLIRVAGRIRGNGEQHDYPGRAW